MGMVVMLARRHRRRFIRVEAIPTDTNVLGVLLHLPYIFVVFPPIHQLVHRTSLLVMHAHTEAGIGRRLRRVMCAIWGKRVVLMRVMMLVEAIGASRQASRTRCVETCVRVGGLLTWFAGLAGGGLGVAWKNRVRRGVGVGRGCSSRGRCVVGIPGLMARALLI
ncbi:hypothetical protein B0J12DRAFT_691343, partial [Macrophomina phaseolina]